jgi:hypothetical protein
MEEKFFYGIFFLTRYQIANFVSDDLYSILSEKHHFKNED